jgi:hypothetical protein
MKMAVFWVVVPCRLVEFYQCFRGLYCLLHQVQASETLVNLYQSTWCYKPEERHLICEFYILWVYICVCVCARACVHSSSSCVLIVLSYGQFSIECAVLMFPWQSIRNVWNIISVLQIFLYLCWILIGKGMIVGVTVVFVTFFRRDFVCCCLWSEWETCTLWVY